MKTFPPHKNAGKKSTSAKSKSGSGGGGGHNSKINRHTQNHRFKPKTLKPPHPPSSHKRDGASTSSQAGSNGTEETNGIPEKEKEDVRNEYDQFLQVGDGCI